MMLALLAIVMIPLALWLFLIFSEDKGICSNPTAFKSILLTRDSLSTANSLESECFFSESYHEAKDKFVEAAQWAKAEIIPMSVTDELFTHAAVLKGDDKNFLVHISGTHGPEAHLGSATQLALLRYLAQNGSYSEKGASKLPTLVFVHANNPYGFQTSRRVNEDNIDINRNFLTSEEWSFVKTLEPNYADHKTFEFLLNPTKKPFKSTILNEIHSLLFNGFYAWKYGINTLKKALVAGNYLKPNGVGYAGQKYTKSAENLIYLLTNKLKINKKAKRLTLIDVHSGIGPKGVDSLMYSYSTEENTKEENEKRMESIFPTEFDLNNNKIGGLKSFFPVSGLKSMKARLSGEKNESGSDAAAGYELTLGTVSGGLCMNILVPHLKNTQRNCITQEFGTVEPLWVGKYTMEDNYAFFHGTESEKLYYRKRLRECFYVETKKMEKTNSQKRSFTIFSGF